MINIMTMMMMMMEHDKSCPGRLATPAILNPSTTLYIMMVLMMIITMMIMTIMMVLQGYPEMSIGQLDPFSASNQNLHFLTEERPLYAAILFPIVLK